MQPIRHRHEKVITEIHHQANHGLVVRLLSSPLLLYGDTIALYGSLSFVGVWGRRYDLGRRVFAYCQFHAIYDTRLRFSQVSFIQGPG